MSFFRFTAFFLLLMTEACQIAFAARLVPEYAFARKLDPEYDRVYPYYVEVCAVSRIRPINGTEGGGWGHALMYLKGACIDEGAAYPRIRVCREGEVDLQDPDAGVGISVDKMFRSVNWVAVPGKELTFHGNLKAGEVLNQARFDATTAEALRLNLFRGVEFHDEFMKEKPPTQSMEEFVARKTAGTDYAIKFARTSLCARYPLKQSQIAPMVDYLNSRNDEIQQHKVAFQWSAYYDNCAHTVHNALAAAGIWGAKSINQYRIKQFFHQSIPANEFADFAFLGRNQPGALLKIIPAHDPNELFATDYKLFVLEGPIRKPISKKVRRMFADPRYTDLSHNLEYFKTQYEAVLQDKASFLENLVDFTHSDEDDQARIRLIENNLSDIKAKLSQLAAFRLDQNTQAS